MAGVQHDPETPWKIARCFVPQGLGRLMLLSHSTHNWFPMVCNAQLPGASAWRFVTLNNPCSPAEVRQRHKITGFIKELTALRVRKERTYGRMKERGRGARKEASHPWSCLLRSSLSQGHPMFFTRPFCKSSSVSSRVGQSVHYLPVSTPVVEFTLGSKRQPWGVVRGRGRGHAATSSPFQPYLSIIVAALIQSSNERGHSGRCVPARTLVLAPVRAPPKVGVGQWMDSRWALGFPL